jgi:hypothetical protein
MAGLGLGNVRFHYLTEILMDIITAFHVHDASFDVEQCFDELLRGRVSGLKNLLRARFGGCGRGHGGEDQAAMRL